MDSVRVGAGVDTDGGLVQAHEEEVPAAGADSEELEPLFDYSRVQPTIDFCFDGKVPRSLALGFPWKLLRTFSVWMRRFRPREVGHLRPLQQAPQGGRRRRRRRERRREYDRVQFVLMGEVVGIWLRKVTCSF